MAYRYVRRLVVAVALGVVVCVPRMASAQTPSTAPAADQARQVQQVREELDRLKREFDALRQQYDLRITTLEQRIGDLSGPNTALTPIAPASAPAPAGAGIGRARAVGRARG